MIVVYELFATCFRCPEIVSSFNVAALEDDEEEEAQQHNLVISSTNIIYL